MTSALNPPSSADAPRSQRADARRNHERVLAAAAEVFSEYGLAGPIDEIARRAGVGPGTIYRHFPTKAALGEAVVRSHLAKFLSTARELCGSDDACGALFSLLRQLINLAEQKRDLVDELARSGVPADQIAAPAKAEVEQVLAVLWVRAQAEGRVRCDIDFQDVSSLVSATCMAVAGQGRRSADRLASVMCDGLRDGAGRG